MSFSTAFSPSLLTPSGLLCPSQELITFYHNLNFLSKEKTSRLHSLFLKDIMPACSAYHSQDVTFTVLIALSLGKTWHSFKASVVQIWMRAIPTFIIEFTTDMQVLWLLDVCCKSESTDWSNCLLLPLAGTECVYVWVGVYCLLMDPFYFFFQNNLEDSFLKTQTKLNQIMGNFRTLSQLS